METRSLSYIRFLTAILGQALMLDESTTMVMC